MHYWTQGIFGCPLDTVQYYETPCIQILSGTDLSTMNFGSIGGDEALPVLGALVEEAGVDLCLLVLQRDVAGEDEAVLEPLGLVGVAAAVVQHQPAHQLRLSLGPGGGGGEGCGGGGSGGGG